MVDALLRLDVLVFTIIKHKWPDGPYVMGVNKTEEGGNSGDIQ